MIRVRDVIFKRNSLFSDNLVVEKEAIIQEDIETLDIPYPQEAQVTLSDLIEPMQSRLHAVHEIQKEDEPHTHLNYLPTPEPSIRGNTAPPQQEGDEDITHMDAQDAEDDQQTAEEQNSEQQLQ